MQVAHQHLSEALKDAARVKQSAKELLPSYRALAHTSCQKLYELAAVVAERDAVLEAMGSKLVKLTARVSGLEWSRVVLITAVVQLETAIVCKGGAMSIGVQGMVKMHFDDGRALLVTVVVILSPPQEERLLDKLADQEDALTEMKHRLAHMAHMEAAGAAGAAPGTGGQPGDGNRFLGAFQKLRDRNSRPSSPPPPPPATTATTTTTSRNLSASGHDGHVPVVPIGGTAGSAEALAAGWQLPSGGGGGVQSSGGVALEAQHGQAFAYGHTRIGEEGLRDESKVTKWFNKLIRKDEWSDQAAS